MTTTIAVAALMNPLSMSAQQSPALLEITSPAGGTVISPGQTVTVTVTSPANATFDHIGLIGTDEIGIVNALATSVPAQFSVAIPVDMTCRTHTLTARGRTTSGQEASASVQIDVEKPDMPWSISALLRQIIFDAQGDASSIHLLGTFADGSVLDVTESSNVTYSSLNAAVATVAGLGRVTAVAPGRTSIVATDNCLSSSPRAVWASCVLTVTFGPTSTGVRSGAINVASGVNIVPVAFKVVGIGHQ